VRWISFGIIFLPDDARPLGRVSIITYCRRSIHRRHHILLYKYCKYHTRFWWIGANAVERPKIKNGEKFTVPIIRFCCDFRGQIVWDRLQCTSCYYMSHCSDARAPHKNKLVVFYQRGGLGKNTPPYLPKKCSVALSQPIPRKISGINISHVNIIRREGWWTDVGAEVSDTALHSSRKAIFSAYILFCQIPSRVVPIKTELFSVSGRP